MICYKDRAFCDCGNPECPRYLSPEDKARAKELDLPISLILNYHEPIKKSKTDINRFNIPGEST